MTLGALVVLADMAGKKAKGKGATSGARAGDLRFFSAPSRMKDLWEWVAAADAFEHGDARPLSALVAVEDVPAEFRAFVAEVIAGTRRAKRNSDKLKIPAAERMKLAASVAVVLDLTNTLRLHSTSPTLEEIADREGKEVAEVVAELHRESSHVIKEAADEYGVHPETIKNLLRDMRRLVDRWPVV